MTLVELEAAIGVLSIVGNLFHGGSKVLLIASKWSLLYIILAG